MRLKDRSDLRLGRRERLLLISAVGAAVALLVSSLITGVNEITYRPLRVALVSADGGSVCFEGGECATPTVPTMDLLDVAVVGETYCVGWALAQPPEGAGLRKLVDLRPAADCG